MRSLTRSLVTLVLVAGIGAGLSSCGDDAGEGSDDTTSTTSQPEASTTSSVESSGDVDAAAYEAAIVTSLGSPRERGLVVTAAQAECVAPTWVEVIGVDTFTEAEVTPEDVAEASYTPNDLGLDADQGLALIDAFDECDVDLYGQYLALLSDGLDAEQTACLEGEFDEDLSRRFLADALTQPEPSAELEAVLDEIDETCQLSV